ncbi:MAG: EF-hand domain-containing protein, partial [Bryobacteraceae bacterium]
MLRWLYIQLIWLHPAPFRWRFGDDMLDDFDRSVLRAKPRYFADAVASLARQWLLRPEFRPESMPVAADASLEALGVPLFQTIETYKPHPAALFQGGLLAILSISVAVLLIGKAGGVARPFLIGVHSSRPSLLPIDRNSMTGSDLNTTVKLGPDPFEAWLKLARPYFTSMPVLGALDADRDLTLSPWEIGNAPAALRKLDIDYDGKLTPEECGLHIDPNSVPPPLLAQLRQRFMSNHPVLAALDADHDGEISAWEIEHAAQSLKKLDRNHDGYLTADELIPFE